jgi:hypothetical protein
MYAEQQTHTFVSFPSTHMHLSYCVSPGDNYKQCIALYPRTEVNVRNMKVHYSKTHKRPMTHTTPPTNIYLSTNAQTLFLFCNFGT